MKKGHKKPLTYHFFLVVKSENNELGRAVLTVRGVDIVELGLSRIISSGDGYAMIEIVWPEGKGTDVILLDVLFEDKDGRTDVTPWSGVIFERSSEDVL